MNPVAYFSPEYAFEDMPVFAGGLGVLATDYLREAERQGMPCVSLGLFYHYGFAPADRSHPEKIDIAAAGWSVVEQDGDPLILSLPLAEQTVYYQAWYKQSGSVTSYLLDCDIEKNDQEARELTAFLYDKDFLVKLQQNILLGIGGVHLLEALDISPHVFHINEGHAAFATVARLASHKRMKPHATFEELTEAVVAETVASKHTVLSGAGLYIAHDTFEYVLKEYFQEIGLPQEKVFPLAQDPLRKDEFTTTRLMLRMANVTNAVSRSHRKYERTTHPDSEFELSYITNGIHLPRWQDASIADSETDTDIWSAHMKLKQHLIEAVNRRAHSQLDPDLLTLVWARRITGYKRPLELFDDLECVERIVTNPDRPVQIIIAGQANIEDEVGIEMAREIGEHVLNPRFQGRIAYVADYDLTTAYALVSGADVWLNTPEKGYEASGTSGMKAGSNGVLQCSVKDGWIGEVDLRQSGWVLPEINTAETLYGYLEHEIAPLYYKHGATDTPEEWVAYMRHIKKAVEDQFTTERMLKDYKRYLYRMA